MIRQRRRAAGAVDIALLANGQVEHRATPAGDVLAGHWRGHHCHNAEQPISPAQVGRAQQGHSYPACERPCGGRVATLADDRGVVGVNKGPARVGLLDRSVAYRRGVVLALEGHADTRLLGKDVNALVPRPTDKRGFPPCRTQVVGTVALKLFPCGSAIGHRSLPHSL